MRTVMTKKATLKSSDVDGKLSMDLAPPIWVNDFSADNWKKFLKVHRVTDVEVLGDGWAFDPNTGHPTIPNGMYTTEQFVDLMKKWERLDPME